MKAIVERASGAPLDARFDAPTEATAGAAPGAAAAAPLYASLPAAWAGWVEQLMRSNQLPLSGNVDQWIRTWGEAVSQIGLFNVNVAGSGNPSLERRIGSQYSYGRQLGRMLDMLVPLVKANEALLVEAAGPVKVREFEDMARDIDAMKERAVGDIVDEVRGWRRSRDFEARLADLLGRLEALAAGG